MLGLKEGDYIYAIDEKRVLKIKGSWNESYNAYYIQGGGSRGFAFDATHYRMATEEEVEMAEKKDKILKVKPDTEAYEIIYKAYHFHEKWDEHKTEIEEFLGFEKNENLYFSVSSLYINPNKVKDEWKDQFKKNSNPAQAKANSKINKEWKVLCKKLGLEVHEIQTFRYKYGFIFQGLTVYNFADEYYVEFKDGILGGGLFEWAEVISEPDFLRIKADYLELISDKGEKNE